MRAHAVESTIAASLGLEVPQQVYAQQGRERAVREAAEWVSERLRKLLRDELGVAPSAVSPRLLGELLGH